MGPPARPSRQQARHNPLCAGPEGLISRLEPDEKHVTSSVPLVALTRVAKAADRSAFFTAGVLELYLDHGDVGSIELHVPTFEAIGPTCRTRVCIISASMRTLNSNARRAQSSACAAGV